MPPPATADSKSDFRGDCFRPHSQVGMSLVAADFIVVSRAETIALPAGTGRGRCSTMFLKCLRGRDAGSFGMPAPSSIHSHSLTANQPYAEGPGGPTIPVPRFFPGRQVSVRFGLSPPASHAIPETRARIILLLETASAGGVIYTPPLRDVGPGHLQLPGVIVLAAGEPDVAAVQTNQETVTFLVEPRFLRETVSSEVTGATSVNLSELVYEDELIAPLANVFRKLSQSGQRRNAQYIEALGMVMAEHVLQCVFSGEAPADRRGGLPIEAEQRVVAYIDVHYADEFDVDALARASGYSRNHFQRLFKKSFNQTPRDYIRGCQVQHAITLLQTTSLKGMDVALACGFCDETQMARWFGKLRGCLPSQVREATRW
jgi:AraC-like DNA-binding protein